MVFKVSYLMEYCCDYSSRPTMYLLYSIVFCVKHNAVPVIPEHLYLLHALFAGRLIS